MLEFRINIKRKVSVSKIKDILKYKLKFSFCFAALLKNRNIK